MGKAGILLIVLVGDLSCFVCMVRSFVPAAGRQTRPFSFLPFWYLKKKTQHKIPSILSVFYFVFAMNSSNLFVFWVSIINTIMIRKRLVVFLRWTVPENVKLSRVKTVNIKRKRVYAICKWEHTRKMFFFVECYSISIRFRWVLCAISNFLAKNIFSAIST